jgi:iron complex transport system ATP-binding protein
MIEARDVSFSYGQRRSARGAPLVVDGVSHGVPRGAIVGLLGPNGSGKSTLIRLIAGIVSPLAGGIWIDGRPIAQFTRRDLARRLAVVPQETHATFDFSVIDMVLMGRYAHLGPFELEGASDQRIARDALAATGTSALEQRAFSSLSGGEKQRVVIASALAQASDLLLLDEPTASLDLGYQFEIAALLRRLNAERGTTMVVSTHDLNLAASICDHIVLVKQGRVIAQGPTKAILTVDRIRQLYGIEADVQFHARAVHLTVVPIGRSQ